MPCHNSSIPCSRPRDPDLCVQGRVQVQVRIRDHIHCSTAVATQSFEALNAQGPVCVWRRVASKVSTPEYERYVCSGELTGMRMLNLFGIYVGFEALEVLAAPA